MNRVTSITQRIGKGVRGTVYKGSWRQDGGQEQAVAVKFCFLRDPPSASCHADREMHWCQRVAEQGSPTQHVIHVCDAFWLSMDELKHQRARFDPQLKTLGGNSRSNMPVKCAVSIGQFLDGLSIQDWRLEAHSQQEWSSLLWQCLACQLQLRIVYGAVHTDQTITNVMSETVPAMSYITYRLQLKDQVVTAQVPTYGHLWKAIDLASLDSIKGMTPTKVQQRMMSPLQYIRPSPNCGSPGKAAPAAVEATVVAAKAAAKSAGKGAMTKDEASIEAVKAAMAVLLKYAAWDCSGGTELAVVDL